jgi:molybdenum cofactor biosynthesis enzyme MoaA
MPVTAPARVDAWEYLALELTGRCQLACAGCYTSSSPASHPGVMTVDGWLGIIDQAAALGVRRLQLIGGEATLAPGCGTILAHALTCGMPVEVYSNGYRIPEPIWTLLGYAGASLATTYFSDDPTQHDAITGRPGSHARTRASIVRAIEQGVRLRVAVIDHGSNQRMAEAAAELQALGVTNVGVDRVRRIGRAALDGLDPAGQLCGRCGDRRAAITADGMLRPCVMARTLAAGSVRAQPLAELLDSSAWRAAVAAVPTRRGGGCKPDADSGDCKPAETDACAPQYR